LEEVQVTLLIMTATMKINQVIVRNGVIYGIQSAESDSIMQLAVYAPLTAFKVRLMWEYHVKNSLMEEELENL